ncbi:ribosome biogenesis GTPase Der [Capillibacterium thermochitinicola]|uniref:GTPase Der n=1 Tax=Capillibacterium thermochitinicola TaxID=2699427 RepID=A0A8J6HY01_9FIRM|nr:ribosome biogenesis GTPase Der [Capillibacterium thermochitinicola]MBA2133587.1 ribosome biogenesis GTPase Der [Capillibacterium thermochitinicola]
MPKPIVAIVGRPNVGKSTLFNRVIGERLAIVEDIPGITRDRLYRETAWMEKTFLLVDTGGITGNKNDPLDVKVYNQVKLAIEEADVIWFVVDAREGLHPLDQEIADLLRKTKKPLILVGNKVDTYDPSLASEFYALGLGPPILVSAEHALNLGDLLDQTVAEFPVQQKEEEDAIRVALIGRPNTGKSSLLNALLGEERVIVSPIPGTTRDAIDTPFQYQGTNYILVDTAGIRRKAKVEEAVEYYSVLRAIRAVERADVVLVVLDATDFLAEQDKKVAGIAYEAGKAVILVVNKWDLVEKDDRTAKTYVEKLRTELSFLDYAPVLFISAKTGQRVQKVLPEVFNVANEFSKRIPTRALNALLREALFRHQPPSHKGQQLRVYYATQVKVKPPTFQLWVNDPSLMHFSFRRFLENQIRENFGFIGSPIHFLVRARAKE